MAARSTRDALMEQGALLFARHGVGGVTARELHEAVGARNESALHYHFGGRAGLAREIVNAHIAAVERRREPLVAAMVADEKTRDVRELVRAFVVPLADDLSTAVGRAHLRLVAQLDHPALAFPAGRFDAIDASASATLVTWLHDALDDLPDAVRTERLAALYGQLVGLLAQRAQLIDDSPKLARRSSTPLFVANLVDMLVAGLCTAPSTATVAAAADVARGKGRRPAPRRTRA
jgi:AcrR family transcriptional regulator